jgi:predicted ATPase/tRNA A-37 threonylcarbamoyl transferase component Bud32
MRRKPNDSTMAELPAGGSCSRCESQIEAFEHACQKGLLPNIDDYLRGETSERDALLVELAHVDLEFRLKAGESARVEAYLDRYPRLAHDRRTVLDLLETEFELRRRSETDLGLEEYTARFPEFVAELRRRMMRNSTCAAGQNSTIEVKSSRPQLPAVPGYEIIKEIGRGGMGVIYKARQARLKRHVALKFLPTEVVREQALLDRFVREAVTASGLNHPNICTVHELGEHSGRPFIVMEFIEGQTLHSIAQRLPNVAEVAGLIRQAARALAAAHAAGVVHRDIKPENIMVRDDGFVKVLDFGLARKLPTLTKHNTHGANDTSPGALLGTIAFMSPEQIRGEALEGSSDVFSLGVVFYQLVTGRHPFESDSTFSTLHAIAACHPIPPSRLNREIPAGLEGLITSMLSKDARLRPTAAAVETALAATARKQAHRQAPRTATRTIVPRGAELTALRAALADVEAGCCHLVCLAGEPGIGKTTIAEDFLEQLQAQTGDYFIACGRCSERQAGTEAFLPVIDALANLSRDDTSGTLSRLMKVLAPTWHARVVRSPPASDEDVSRASSQQAMLRELCNLLEEISRLAPLVLFFDDVHWADASTVDLLAHLGRHGHRLRVLVIVTFRPTELLLGSHPFHSVKLDLQAQGACSEVPVTFLARSQIDSYLSLAFPGHAFSSAFADLVHARTEGSPLFMVDLLRYLSERGVIKVVQGRWSLACDVPDLKQDLPESVRSMIQRKLQQLDAEDRKLLSAAAIQGHEFDSAAVAFAIDRDAVTVEERLQVLERVHGLVRRFRETEFPDRTLNLRYAFVHVLYQQALAADITPTRRASLSLALARALERFHASRSADAAAEIACLYEVGREFGDAARFFHLAVQNAGQVFAHRDAIILAQRALRLLDALPPSAARDKLELPLQMTLGLHIQMTESCAADLAKRAYDRARELHSSASDARTLFAILWGLWLYFKVRSQLHRAQELADQLLTLAHDLNDADLALQAHQALGLTALCRGDPSAALRHVEQVAVLYNPDRHIEHAVLFGQDPAVICKAFGAIALWLLGFPDSAQRQSEAAIAMSRELSPTSQSIALHFAAMLQQLCRNAEKTQEYAIASASIAAEHGLSFWLAGGNVMIGWALVATGNAEEGIRQLRQGMLDWQATGSATYRTYYLALLAESLGRREQFAEALDVLNEALALTEHTDERFYEAELYRLRGEMLLRDRGARESTTTDQGAKAFRLAIAVSRQQSARSLELRAAVSLARLQGNVVLACESQNRLAEAYGAITQGRDTRELSEARDLLESCSDLAIE